MKPAPGAYMPWDGVARKDDGGASWHRLCDAFVLTSERDENALRLVSQYGELGRVFACWEWNTLTPDDIVNTDYPIDAEPACNVPCWLRAALYRTDDIVNARVYLPHRDLTAMLSDPHEASILAAVRDLLLAETYGDHLDDWGISKRVNYVRTCAVGNGDQLTRW